jgi:hypothetical protein
MRKLVTAAAIAASLLGTVELRAQTCLGLPTFASGFVHVNAVVELPDSATGYAVGIGAGRPNELFGNIGGGSISYEGLDGKSTFGFLELGYQKQLGRAQVCPIGGLYVGSGPNDDAAGFEVSTRGLSAGAALGLPVTVPFFRRLSVVPNAALRYEYLSQNISADGSDDLTDVFHSGVLDVGLGFVFFDRVSIQPLMHFPFGGDDQDPSFALFGSVSVGWRDR